MWFVKPITAEGPGLDGYVVLPAGKVEVCEDVLVKVDCPLFIVWPVSLVDRRPTFDLVVCKPVESGLGITGIENVILYLFQLNNIHLVGWFIATGLLDQPKRDGIL